MANKVPSSFCIYINHSGATPCILYILLPSVYKQVEYMIKPLFYLPLCLQTLFSQITKTFFKEQEHKKERTDILNVCKLCTPVQLYSRVNLQSGNKSFLIKNVQIICGKGTCGHRPFSMEHTLVPITVQGNHWCSIKPSMHS